jgi:hypothetical protein
VEEDLHVRAMQFAITLKTVFGKEAMERSLLRAISVAKD